MTDSPVVGSAAFELRATRDQLKKDLALAERDLKQATGQMETDANKAAGGISAGMNKIGAAVAAMVGFLTAATVAALALGRASFKMASDLDNAAKRIGVTTTFLQEFEYVARKTGGSTQDAEAAIDGFAKKFASAAAGLSKADLDSFKAIGFTQQDLRNFGSMEEALEETVNRISDLRSESDRTAAATQAGLGAMAYAFRDGGDAIAEMRDEAHTAGEIMDEALVIKGAKAQEQMEHLGKVIGVEMASAFVQLSDEVIAFTESLAQALGKLNDLLATWNRWKERANFNGDMPDDFEQRAARFGPVGLTAGTAHWSWRRWFGDRDQRNAEYNAGFGEADEPFLQRQQRSAAAYDGPPPRTPGRDYLTPVQRTPRQRVDRTAEREARRAERIEQELYRARQRLLDVTDEELLTVQQRFDLARQQTVLEREARDKKLARDIQQKEITAEEGVQFRAINQQTDALEDQVANAVLARDLSDERLAQERLLTDLTTELLSLQSAAARTSDERRRIELALLADAQKRARENLERDPEFLKASPERQAQIRAEQQRVFDAQTEATNRANLGPLERWRDQSLKSAAEVQEAYERIAVDGIDALNDGLVDAIMNSRSLGDVFGSVAKQILADLLKISVRRGITEPLVDVVFGNTGIAGQGGNRGGDILGSLFRSTLGKIPGFSSGVSNFGGGLAYVHQGEILANLPKGTDVIPAHAVQALGGGKTPMHFDLRGAVMTSDLLQQMQGMANASGGTAFTSARKAVPSDMAKTDRYTLGRHR